MNKMNKSELQELEQLLQKMTPGPYEFWGEPAGAVLSGKCAAGGGKLIASMEGRAVADEFRAIVALLNAAPELIRMAHLVLNEEAEYSRLLHDMGIDDEAEWLAAAMSLYNVGHRLSMKGQAEISALFDGADNFIRSCSRMARHYVRWADQHVAFDQTSCVWVYLLEDRLGDAVQAVWPIERWVADTPEGLFPEISRRLEVPLHEATDQQA